MKRPSATAFRKGWQSLLANLPPEGVLITRHGRAVARLMPAPKDNADLIGSLAGVLETRGDVMSTGDKWDGQS